ncbi:MAG: hypothetical protein WC026_13040 [Hyphomicrobium sp.]|uniref:hypothetical protein n=1 Tax=Hyphomicrobium sp. TaxID=82 RepID=UPI003568B5FF
MKDIIQHEINLTENTLKNIEIYPDMYQSNAKDFYQGRKQMAEELLTKFLSSGTGSDKLESFIKRLSSMKDDSGREGCTYGDTEHDSISAVYGYNLAIDHVIETLQKGLK